MVGLYYFSLDMLVVANYGKKKQMKPTRLIKSHRGWKMQFLSGKKILKGLEHKSNFWMAGNQNDYSLMPFLLLCCQNVHI